MIKAFTAADVDRITSLQPEGWQDIRLFFRFYVRVPFCLPLKIETKGEIVAIGSLIQFHDTAWLAHIIVGRSWRGKGLGKMMTSRLIATAEKKGCTTQLLIATHMGVPLYERLSFQHSMDYNFYVAPDHLLINKPSDVRSLSPDDLVSLHELDCCASGEDRLALLKDSMQDGRVYEEAGSRKLTGYYLPQLGEGAIIAQDATSGAALMAVRCRTTCEKPVIPAKNAKANAILLDMGFTLQSTAKRMVRHGDDPLEPTMIFNRIGGHLG